MSEASGWSSDGRSVRPRARSDFFDAVTRTSRDVAMPASRRGSRVVCSRQPLTRRQTTSAAQTTPAIIRATTSQ